jgi:hypothetical protein
MQITILDREDAVTYDEIPYGSAFMWRKSAPQDYDLFMKPSIDLQLSNAAGIHAVEVGVGRTVRFEYPDEKKFIPVTIETIKVRLK